MATETTAAAPTAQMEAPPSAAQPLDGATTRGAQQMRTTRVVPDRHSSPLRGFDLVPGSSTEQGRFGRMFRRLPVYEHRKPTLRTLAERMVAEAEPDKKLGERDANEHPDLPSGYTYLGQFVDHDITFDPVSSLQRQNDPDALHNFRTPRFDLDCLYGRGPADQPYLYNHLPAPVPHPTRPDVDLRGTQFLLGQPVSGDPAFAGPDLPRNVMDPGPPANGGPPVPAGRALIGDPRNDENLIVSQLHLTFLRFHNRMVELTAQETRLRGENLFKEAQRRVRWHYQWAVVHDFLPRIVGPEVVDDILGEETYVVGGTSAKKVARVRPRLLFYKWRERPFMPVEFAGAAYRFGHTLVRPTYFFNDRVRGATENSRPFGDARTAIFSVNPHPLANLNGFRPLPGEWGFQWKYFFPPAGRGERHLPQPAYKLDAQLVFQLGSLPPAIAQDPASLPERNLLRGLALGLPAGQTVAEAMGIEPLSNRDLGVEGGGFDRTATRDLTDHAPLWYYVLKEAEVLGGSKRLGPVGGRIVAEVLVGLLHGDPLSYLGVQPNWRPTLGSGGDFTMTDLIAFATAA